VLAPNGSIARVDGAGILIVTEVSRLGSVNAFGGLVLGFVGPVAFVISTGVAVVTVRVDHASRRRTFEVSVVYKTSRLVANIEITFIRGRDSYVDGSASLNRVAGEEDALVRVTLSAFSDFLVDLSSCNVTSVLGARIRCRNRYRSRNTTLNRVALPCETLVGLIGRTTDISNESVIYLTSSAVTLVD